MTTIYPQESWCAACRVSHPPGTKRCLHCGGRVEPAHDGSYGTALRAAPRPAGLPEPASRGGAADEEEELQGVPRLRVGMAAVWIVLAIVAAVVRACSGQG